MTEEAGRDRSEERWKTLPKWIWISHPVLALTLFCLAAFLAAVPLPRVDGNLVGSDGVGYYVYLPSVVIDGDLDFTDEYSHFYGYRSGEAERAIENRTPTGLPANRFGIGPAVLWLPFFLLAHVLALFLASLGVGAADGYGYLYQIPVLAGSIIYGGLAAWLCMRTAQRWVGETASRVAMLLIVFGGNLLYYLIIEPSMSHAISAFLSSAFFAVWLTARGRESRLDAAGLGALAGLLALVRPQDGLLLALPIIEQGWKALPSRRFGPWVGHTLISVAVALVVFLPQLLVWRLLNGGFLRSGYHQDFDLLFRWGDPQLHAVLLSAHRGLIVWHPVFLAALLGLVLLWRTDRTLTGLMVLAFSTQWYVIASWHDWAQGDAFGGRMFLVLTPIFVIGLAVLLDRLSARWGWKWICAGGLVLVGLNLLLLLQYRLDFLADRRVLTFFDLSIGRLLWPFF